MCAISSYIYRMDSEQGVLFFVQFCMVDRQEAKEANCCDCVIYAYLDGIGCRSVGTVDEKDRMSSRKEYGNGLLIY